MPHNSTASDNCDRTSNDGSDLFQTVSFYGHQKDVLDGETSQGCTTILLCTSQSGPKSDEFDIRRQM